MTQLHQYKHEHSTVDIAGMILSAQCPYLQIPQVVEHLFSDDLGCSEINHLGGDWLTEQLKPLVHAEAVCQLQPNQSVQTMHPGTGLAIDFWSKR